VLVLSWRREVLGVVVVNGKLGTTMCEEGSEGTTSDVVVAEGATTRGTGTGNGTGIPRGIGAGTGKPTGTGTGTGKGLGDGSGNGNGRGNGSGRGLGSGSGSGSGSGRGVGVGVGRAGLAKVSNQRSATWGVDSVLDAQVTEGSPVSPTTLT